MRTVRRLVVVSSCSLEIIDALLVEGNTYQSHLASGYVPVESA